MAGIARGSEEEGVQLKDIVQPARQRLVLPKRLDVLLPERQRVGVARDEPSTQGLRAEPLRNLMSHVKVYAPRSR